MAESLDEDITVKKAKISQLRAIDQNHPRLPGLEGQLAALEWRKNAAGGMPKSVCMLTALRPTVLLSTSTLSLLLLLPACRLCPLATAPATLL
jgi:hypothetical protein